MTLAAADYYGDDVEEFLEYVSNGNPPLNAAVAVGWTPAKFKQYMADKDFAELVATARDILIGNVEAKAFDMAQRGHFGAMQMVLYNFAKDRWRPPQQKVQIDQNVTVSTAEVEGAKQAIMEIIRTQGVEAVQPSPAAIEAAAADD